MIVVAGVIAGVVVGAAAVGHDDYSDHSDYSDAAERERRRREAQRKADKQRRAAARDEARRELDGLIQKSVRSFEARQGVSVDTCVGASDCSFKDFDEDMQPMTDSAHEAIKLQVGSDIQRRVVEEKERIKQIDRVIQRINEHILMEG